MEMRLIKEPIAITEVTKMAKQQFGEMIKAVVDINKQIMALGGELHADEEAMLLEDGSQQLNLWGINLYPAKFGTSDFIEFDSMVNIRPSQGNRSRGVENISIQKQIREVIENLVTKAKK